jgi:hypothetical protein
MSASLRDQWKQFIALPSGRRFQSRNRLHRERPTGLLRKVLMIGFGCVLILAGVVMLVLPGPGLLVLIIGAALIAEESLIAARALDRIDAWITRRVQRWRQRRAERKV